MIRYEGVWPNAPSPKPFLDTWKDSEARASCDKAAAALPSGGNYWGGEEVQIGENNVVPFAKKPSGPIVQDEPDKRI